MPRHVKKGQKEIKSDTLDLTDLENMGEKRFSQNETHPLRSLTGSVRLRISRVRMVRSIIKHAIVQLSMHQFDEIYQGFNSFLSKDSVVERQNREDEWVMKAGTVIHSLSEDDFNLLSASINTSIDKMPNDESVKEAAKRSFLTLIDMIGPAQK